MNHPFVSVVISVRNNPQGIKQALNALISQDYPNNRYEIIVIDNDSSDRTPAEIKKFDVKMIEERRDHNPYIARNRGVKASKGEIVAFTDSDCIPNKNWLTEGTISLEKNDADMIGGYINFIVDENSSIPELTDSIVFLQQELYVNERKSACTANLFITKETIKSLNYFSENTVYDGDTRLTRKATQQGYKLVFEEKTIVDHRPRSLKELLIKSFRIGRDKGTVLRGKYSEWPGGIIEEFHYSISSPILVAKLNPKNLSSSLRKQKIHISKIKFLGILLTCYFMVTSGITGVFYGLIMGKKTI